jgi:hypothetical protein
MIMLPDEPSSWEWIALAVLMLIVSTAWLVAAESYDRARARREMMRRLMDEGDE